jgi:hypothetical protein
MFCWRSAWNKPPLALTRMLKRFLSGYSERREVRFSIAPYLGDESLFIKIETKREITRRFAQRTAKWVFNKLLSDFETASKFPSKRSELPHFVAQLSPGEMRCAVD